MLRRADQRMCSNGTATPSRSSLWWWRRLGAILVVALIAGAAVASPTQELAHAADVQVIVGWQKWGYRWQGGMLEYHPAVSTDTFECGPSTTCPVDRPLWGPFTVTFDYGEPIYGMAPQGTPDAPPPAPFWRGGYVFAGSGPTALRASVGPASIDTCVTIDPQGHRVDLPQCVFVLEGANYSGGPFTWCGPLELTLLHGADFPPQPCWQTDRLPFILGEAKVVAPPRDPISGVVSFPPGAPLRIDFGVTVTSSYIVQPSDLEWTFRCYDADLDDDVLVGTELGATPWFTFPREASCYAQAAPPARMGASGGIDLIGFEIRRNDALPVASFTYSVTDLARSIVAFDASASFDPDGGFVSFVWDFGDGTGEQAGDARISHTFPAGGIYHVSLRVTDDEHGIAIVAADVTVGVAKLSVAVSAPTAAAIGDDIAITVVLVNDGTVPIDAPNVTTAIADGGGGIVLRSGPTPGLPPTLAPGGSFSTVYVYRASNTGAPTFTFTGAGQAGTQSLSEQRSVQVTVGMPLVVELSVTPNRLELTLPARTGPFNVGPYGWDSPGPGGLEFEPKDATATVRVKNMSSGTARNVQLLGQQYGLDFRVVQHRTVTNPDGTTTQTTEGMLVPGVFPLDVVAPFPAFATGATAAWGLGDLAPGEERTLTYHLKVRNGAVFELKAQVHAGGTAGDLAGLATAEIDAKSNVKLLFEAGLPLSVVGQNPRIDGGRTLPVWGIVKNLSPTETIRIDPIVPLAYCNGAALMSFENTSGSPVSADDGTRIEAFLGKRLGPSETLWWTAFIQTEEIVPPPFERGVPASVCPDRTDIYFFPTAWTVDGTGRETALPAQELRVDLGNGSRPPDAFHSAPYLTAGVQERLVVPPLTADWGYATVTATMNLVEGAASGIAGTFQLAYQWGSLLLESITNPSKTALRAIELSRYLADAWRRLPPEARSNIVLYTAQKLREAGYPIEHPELWTGVEQTQWYKDMETATAAGDTTALVNVWAKAFRPIGEYAGPELAFATAARISSLMILRDPATREGYWAVRHEAEIAERAKLEQALAENVAAGDSATHEPVASLKAIDPELTLGMTAADVVEAGHVPSYLDRGLVEATKTKPVVVALDPLPWYMKVWWDLGAIFKPEWTKIKTVFQKTAEILGYRPGSGYGVGDVGSVVLAEPLPRSVFDARFAAARAAGENEVAAAAVRDYATRLEEWVSTDAERSVHSLFSTTTEVPYPATRPDAHLYSRLRYSYEPFPAEGLSGRANLDGGGATVLYHIRRVEYRQVKNPPDNDIFRQMFARDREYWEMWAETEPGSGVFQRVVSDPDPILVMGMDGTALSINDAALAANWLSNLGIQHFWTMTYKDIPAARAILSKYVKGAPGAKPLLIYADGKRGLAYLESLDWLEPLHRGEPVHIRLVGAPDVWARGVVDIPTTPLALPPAPPGPSTYIDPVSGFRSLASAGDLAAPAVGAAASPAARVVAAAAATFTPCADRFSSDAGALVLRVNRDLSFDRWLPDAGWRPTTLKEDCLAGRVSDVRVAPQTALRNAVQPGATVLDSLSLQVLAGNVPSAWFRIGDAVVIGPGTPTEERRTLTSVAPLTLDSPLRFTHYPREVVSAYSPAQTFTVTKVYAPVGPTAPVSVTLSCTSGTVSPNAAQPTPATFTVSGASAGTTCTATESPVPAGYTPSGCVAVALSAGGCTLTNTLTPTAARLDQFLCYRTSRENPEWRPLRGVVFADQFNPGLRIVVKKPEEICNPTAQLSNGQAPPILHPDDDLRLYTIGDAERPDDDDDEHQFGGTRKRTVEVSDQFGTRRYELSRPSSILVPATTALLPAQPGDPATATNGHFLCYAVKDLGPHWQSVRNVVLADRFGLLRVVVEGPELLCNPSEKRHDGQVYPVVRQDPDAHLMCYRLKEERQRDSGAFQARMVRVRDQFIMQTISVDRPDMLCVPASRRQLPLPGGG